MFDTGCFIELNPQKAVWGRLLYPFLLNVYMHDFDQFVENLNDEYLNIIMLSTNKNHSNLAVKECGNQRRREFSNQMLKKYDEQVQSDKIYGKILSNCALGKGRPLEDVWEFCCAR